MYDISKRRKERKSIKTPCEIQMSAMYPRDPKMQLYGHQSICCRKYKRKEKEGEKKKKRNKGNLQQWVAKKKKD